MAHQLGAAGDFLTFDLGPESILCVRGSDGEVRAFYNVCQHRAMPLTTEAAGNARLFSCPYHGWIYDRQGRLKVVPDAENFAGGSPCGHNNLRTVRCEIKYGFIWINMDDHCASLDDYLGPVAQELARYSMDQMHRTKWVTIEGDFNWKLIQDNFSESYHLNTIHPDAKFFMEQSYKRCEFTLYPGGHGRMVMPGATPSKAVKGGEKETLAWMSEDLIFWGLNPDDFKGRFHDMREALQKQKRSLGAEKGYDFDRLNDSQLVDHWHYNVFPNLSLSLKPDGNIFLRARPHDRDPEKCYLDMWYLTWFPEGVDRYYVPTLANWVDRTAPTPHVQGRIFEIETALVIEQDLPVWAIQHRGYKSRGFTRDRLAGQESRIAHFHHTLDQRIAEGKAGLSTSDRRWPTNSVGTD